MGYYSLFFCRYYETDVVIFLKQEAMQVSGAGGFTASKAKRRKLKIGLPNSTEISSPILGFAREAIGSTFGRVPVCGRKTGAVHQSGDSAVNKTIRPLPSNGSARSIISAGPGDGCRNAVIDGSVCPSNLSADTEGLTNHERNEDRRPRRHTPPVPPPAEESIKVEELLDGS